jgi:hypothetical protein
VFRRGDIGLVEDLDGDGVAALSISAGKPTRLVPPLRTSISSGSSPKVQAV